MNKKRRNYIPTVCLWSVAAVLLASCRSAPSAVIDSSKEQSIARVEQMEEKAMAALEQWEAAMERAIPQEEREQDYAGSYFDENHTVRIGIVGEENREKYAALVPPDILSAGMLIFETRRFSLKELQTSYEAVSKALTADNTLTRATLSIRENCVRITVQKEADIAPVQAAIAGQTEPVVLAALSFQVDPNLQPLQLD